MDNLIVSVAVITYNQEQFIKQTLLSVLNQITKFNYNIIVSNDCSTDNTNNEILQVINKNDKTKQIFYHEHTANLGMHDNLKFAFKKCSGKYIAICEGDDYWTDPYKLQKQVDFLDKNPDFEVCFTNISICNSEGKILKDRFIPEGRRTIYETQHLPTWAPTLTRVFKNRDFSNLSNTVPGLDTYMLLYQSHFGKIYFLDQITGVYRKHDGGVYSALSVYNQKESNMLTLMESVNLVDSNLYPKYQKLILKKLLELRFLDKHKYRTGFHNVKNYMKHNSKNFSKKQNIKINLFFVVIGCFDVIGLKGNKHLFLKITDKLI